MNKSKSISKPKNKEKRFQIVEIKNPHIKCSLHGIQKLKQSTKYGSALCEQCLKDIKDFLITLIKVGKNKGKNK